MAKHGVLGISFDHMHMGDLLREVAEHPDAEIAGIFDPDRARMAGGDRRNSAFPRTASSPTSRPACRRPRPTSPSSARRPPSTPTPSRRSRRTACNILVEKPFAASVADARRMIAAMQGTGGGSPSTGRSPGIRSHNTAKRLIDEGAIGDLIEVHFYDGNRGPLYPPRRQGGGLARGGRGAEAAARGGTRRRRGGGSLLDYLGYGVTLGTWFMNGEAPIEVTCVVDETPGIEVDQHSITVCRYARGLSKFETRWGTFTDPWTQQPQPKCGFVLVGTRRHHLQLRLRRPRHAADARSTGADAGAGRHAAAGPARAGRIHARPHRGRRADHRAARPGALPRRAADHRQRRALGRDEAHRPARRMSETPDLDAYSLKSAAAAEVAAPELPYRPPMPRKLSAAHRAGRRRRHFGGASRRLPGGGLRRRGDLQPHARQGRGAAGRVSSRTPRRRTMSSAR